MTPEELTAHRDLCIERQERYLLIASDFAPAAEDVESIDHSSDGYAEAIFLRAFTAYENDLEQLFLHYVTGGLTMQGVAANTYLRVNDAQLARKLTRAGWKFLSWAKPQETRTTAANYLENGWPLNDMMNARSHDLADCERIRNRIAHNSLEAASQFNIVQRNMLHTERLFPISPGQFLRIRNTRLRKLHLVHYLEAMHSTVQAILDPPA